MTIQTPAEKDDASEIPEYSKEDAGLLRSAGYAGLPLILFCIRGVGGLVLLPATPLACGTAPLVAGVGAPPAMSSSVLTPEGRLLFCPAGDVVALALELLPCWLCCICIAGACITPAAGLPIRGEPGN